jgi:DnaK suppressor protein
MAAKKSGKPKASAQSAARASKQPAPKKTSAKAKPAAKKNAASTGAKKPVTTKTRSNKQASVKKTKTAAAKASAKKAPAKKTPAKKAPAKKVTAKKTATAKAPAKKAPAKKAPAKKAPAKKVTAKKTAASKSRAKRDSALSLTLSSGGITGASFTPYQPKRNEEYMSENQHAHFRAILMEWRRDLMEEVDRTVSHLKDEAANYPDPSDRASQEEEFSLELRTRDRERKLIRKIEKTLELIDHDDYGFCETCGIEIGIRRLEARPTATECIDCKTLAELKERQLHG